VVQGSVAHFWDIVNEADKTITFPIKTSTFPNWGGAAQKRPFTLIGDMLKYTVVAATGRGTAEVVLRRVKYLNHRARPLASQWHLANLQEGT
jgi:hypothetical protein